MVLCKLVLPRPTIWWTMFFHVFPVFEQGAEGLKYTGSMGFMYIAEFFATSNWFAVRGSYRKKDAHG